MEIWATAHAVLLNSPLDEDPGDLPLKVFQNNKSTPMILVNKDGSIKTNNMPKEVVEDTTYIKEKILKFHKREVL